MRVRRLVSRALAFQTVYVAHCYGTETYIIKAATEEQAKARLFDAGVEAQSVETLAQAGELLADGEVTKLS